jgi:Zn2+/Cd2+-exporting ATPase
MQKNIEIKENIDLNSNGGIETGNPEIACSHCEHDGHTHAVPENEKGWKSQWKLILALFILIIMLVLRNAFNIIPANWINFLIHVFAFVLAGSSILQLAFRKIIRGNIFNEFVLMSVATLGAFYIGAYSEGVAVMVFYCIGEWFQDTAVSNAKRSIKALLDIRPDEVVVLKNDQQLVVHPSEIKINDIIIVRHGEKVALDGELLSAKGSFNASALTGESKPVSKYQSELIYAGMINLNTVAEIKVKALFEDSALSRILKMVQDATARKSPTQLFISRFAKIYTPIVFFLALALCLLPYFFVDVYHFDEWFYRSLVFLVISCPCALVISIPLGYFGGIGLASRNGVLFKGGNFLDAITKINTVVMDKTGTLTKGVFKVQNVYTDTILKDELIMITAALEKHSTHPIAKAITDFAGEKISSVKVTDVEEIAGMGLKGIVDGKEIVAGNLKLFGKYQIHFPHEIKEGADTIVAIGINKVYAGYFTIADEIKDDAIETMKGLHRLHIRTIMLSGDKQSVTDNVAQQLGIDESFGNLMPEDKLERVQQLKNAGRRVAFIGDGVNDAPVIALADVGIAMGGLGSHAAIETADVVIQNDQPSKIVTAIKIGKITRNIVWQNIIMALAVKLIVLILGAEGFATLWEAVIADVGVALLAILNAIRIQRKHL